MTTAAVTATAAAITASQDNPLYRYAIGLSVMGLDKDEVATLTHKLNADNGALLGEAELGKVIEAASNFRAKNDINRSLPTIVATGRQHNPLLEEIVDSLMADDRLFRHGGGLISLHDGAIAHHTQDTVPALLSRWANFIDHKNRSTLPPSAVGKSILFSIDDDRIRALERVVNFPALRADGSLLDVPGYDPVSKLYYHPLGPVPSIPSHPTQEDAERAAAWLCDMLCDFPFDSEPSRTNYLALLMTFVVRELVGCVPLALLDAPRMGSGKSLLASITGIVATGKASSFGLQLGDNVELRKNLTARLREGPSIICFDNIDEVIKSPVLAALLTLRYWEDRLLGRSRLLTLPMRAVVLATGNNIKLGGDIPRRCYHVRIDANAVRPWEGRTFKYRLPEYALENRGAKIANLLVMARAWLCAGRPQGHNPVLGSFEEWCNVTGGILEYAGLQGFLGNLSEMRRATADEEDDTEAWSAWIAAIFSSFGEEPFTAKNLSDAMHNAFVLKPIQGTKAVVSEEDLRDSAPYSLGDIGASNDQAWLIRLGKTLSSHVGQVFEIDGAEVKLTQSKDGHGNRNIYKLVKK
jgi:hypothetical protein